MRQIVIALTAFLLLNQLLFAQTIITGKVTDSKSGTPLEGVSIRQKGSNSGVQTGTDGIFRISIAGREKILIFSYIGYVEQEIKPGNRDNIVVSLVAGEKKLEEVVVVAYGTSSKINLTGSVTSVSGASVENKPFTAVDKALQGAVAGLQSSSFSGAPGSATSIRIRGIGSLTADANPLWVIDGAIATIGDQTSNTTTSNALNTLNPDDIESISILKDAASTAVYGSRGANGVILVTTKKGKAGKTHLNFSSEYGSNSIAYKNKNNRPMTTAENLQVLHDAVLNYAAENGGDFFGTPVTPDNVDAVIEDPSAGFGLKPNVNTNWFDLVTRSANQSQFNISMSGGTEKTQVYASAGFFNQDGTVIASSFKRYNGSLAVTHKPNDKITITSNISGGYSLQKTPTDGGAFANPVLASFFLLPWYSPYNSDGSLKYNDPENEFPNTGGTFNPLVIAKFDNNNTGQITLRGFLMGEYRITKNLKLTSRYSGEFNEIQENSYNNPLYGDGYALNGRAASLNTRLYNYTWSNFFDYRQDLNKEKDFYFDFKGGYEAQAVTKNFLSEVGQAFPQTLALQYLASAATPTSTYYLPSGTATTSLFAIGDLNYKDRYVLSGSFRRDGSSVFGPDKRYGTFYSVGGAWNIHEEGFMKNTDVFNLLKLRSSYGTAGNSNGFGFYSALPTYGFGTNYNAFGINYTGLPGSVPTNVGNVNLTWEKTAQFNVAVDWAMFKNRFSGTVEYYDRMTSSLLLAVPLSLTSGFSTQNQNVGSLYNKGIEVTLGGRPVNFKNFTWDILFNISHNTNKVTALYQDKPVAASQFNYTVGYDAQTYYFRQWAGVDPTNGDPLWYTDATHKQKTNDVSNVAHVLNHSASPKIFGSLTNTFSVKGFSLSAQLYYNFGNYVFDQWGTYQSSEGLYLGSLNQYSQELTAWKKAGDVTNVPKIIYGGNDNSYLNSTRFLYKGDYIRLRDIQLSYSIPQQTIKKSGISNITLYVRGTNLLTFGTDKNLPIDPENGISSTGNLDIFIPKTITAGLKIGL
jgi:TonB-linked SusC/RagA family outer membrane protein